MDFSVLNPHLFRNAHLYAPEDKGRCDLLIAADGGYDWLLQSGLTPQFLLGDLDSLGRLPVLPVAHAALQSGSHPAPARSRRRHPRPPRSKRSCHRATPRAEPIARHPSRETRPSNGRRDHRIRRVVRLLVCRAAPIRPRKPPVALAPTTLRRPRSTPNPGATHLSHLALG